MIKMMKYGEVPSSEIFARGTAETDVSDIVADILAEVRQKGDAALLAYAKQFDKADLRRWRSARRRSMQPSKK